MCISEDVCATEWAYCYIDLVILDCIVAVFLSVLKRLKYLNLNITLPFNFLPQ